jgi:alcohol dehydrogenase YqhD (iron-dependent ADH family)
MNDFEFLCPTRLIVGKNAEEQTGKWVKAYGGHKVLVHYGSSYVKRSGLVDKVIKAIRDEGIDVVELGGVVPNPRLSLVYEGIRLCREEKIDFLVAVGGGSVIDSAKAIAMGVPYDGDVWDFFIEDEKGIPRSIPVKCLPTGVVLTFAAAGSECSNSCVITKEDGNLKRFCDNDVNRPVFAIENPELTMSLSRFQTACGIVDMMAHSMERYFSPDRSGNELTDRLCEAIFLACMDCAHILLDSPDDYDARANIMVVSSISHCGLTGMGRNGDWSSHIIEHELSGEYDMAHGAGLAIIIPAWMRYVYRAQPVIFLKWATRVMNVAYDFNNPERTILQAIDKLENFFRSLGIPTRLNDSPQIKEEVTEEVMWKLADRVRITNADSTVGGLVHLNAQDIVNILKLAK